jgi:alpha-D-ribose 1-methylphosphonate 5-triphosphate diphosphatase
MVTWAIADALGLDDRGHLRAGLRADVLRYRVVGETPVVRGLWCEGRHVM